MAISTESPKASSISSAASLSREPAPESFRYYLRQADKLIKENQFAKAKQLLDEAKKIDPANPFIFAFEERLRLFADKKTPDSPVPASVPAPESKSTTHQQETPPVTRPETVEPDAEAFEQKLRQKLENEYKSKYTHELKKAEEEAATLLAEERTKFEHQQQVLKAKFEQELVSAQQRLDAEHRAKMEEELARAEKRLEEKFREKVELSEQELQGQLKLSQEERQLQLHQQLKKEQDDVLEQERKSFQEREKKLKESYDRQLLEALRKTEAVIRDQSTQQQEFEKDQLRQKLAVEFQASLQSEREASKAEYDAAKATLEQKLSMEFQASLHNEREAIKAEYDAMKAKIEQSFHDQQDRLKAELQAQYDERLTSMKQLEAEKFAQESILSRQEVETREEEKYKVQLAAEREKIRKEIEASVEAEKQRLKAEYDELIGTQEQKIKKIRTELQKEMEASLISRMQQFSNEVDHKMELLGATVPEAADERHAFYREKMRDCYVKGEPTIDEAKRIMELKELLGLTFDEHLAIETDIRLDLYVDHVERKITMGEVNLKEVNALDPLKERYRITPEESARLEPYILSCLQRLAVKGKLLIVDDDLLLLQSLDDLLSTAGYQIVPAESVASAQEYLKSNPVDLILSDVKFSESDLDGFQFYTSVQAQPHLRRVPFIFMSSLRDGVIIRSGVQLGVDDYLTKPLDPDLLTAVIEGKLKRFRNFDRD